MNIKAALGEEEMNSHRLKSGWIKIVLLTALFALPLIFFVSGLRNGIFGKLSDEEVERTFTVCRDLVVPAHFTKVRDFEMVKSTHALVSGQYASEADPETVFNYFEELLIPLGWTATRHSDDAEESAIFQRQGISITIGYREVPFRKDQIYYVGCSYGLR